MKKNTLYIILLVVFAGTAGFVLMKYNKDKQIKSESMYALLESSGSGANTEEWKNTKKNVNRLMETLKAKPGDTKTLIALSNLFILEARATGNYTYYDMGAMKYINEILKNDPNNFEALTLKSLVYLSQHHFADGLATAQKAAASNSHNAFVQGVLVDGYVEMGNYDSAVISAENMMSIRPDLRSYARASYLREIYGDYPGAIEAMKLAIQAGAEGDESTEWSRVQLGHLYENTGDLKNAEMQYTIALQGRPGYVHALAGMAHISMAAKDYNQAITYYQQADSSGNDFSFKEELADAYILAGQKDKAAAITKNDIEEMSKKANAGNKDETIGHYADRELAHAYLKINDYDKALEHALAEYNRRPNNIDVNETLAWVYYKKGDNQKALPYIKTALKTNSKNPTLLCRAALIYKKEGDRQTEKKYFEEALKNNPNIAEGLKNESNNAMQQL